MCTRKATMVIRYDKNNSIVIEGNKIKVGGNETYKSVCRKHFRELTQLI
jgi:thymidine kinase